MYAPRVRRLLPALLVTCLSAPLSAGWPTDATSLAEGVGAADPAVRKKAAAKLVGVSPRVAAPLVPKLLDDADVEVRLAAAEAAVAQRIPAEAQVLPWLAEADARLRVAAARVLALGASEKALAPLTRALSDTQPAVRRVAARALSAVRSGDAVTALLGHMDDATPDVRVEVLTSLARLGDPRAAAPVAGRTQDAAPEVRVAALRALADLGDAKTGKGALPALADVASEVRREAAVAVGRLGVLDATKALAGLTRKTEPPEVRRAALVALARLGTEESTSALVAALRDDEKGASPAKDALLHVGKDKARLLGVELGRAVDEKTAVAVASALVDLGAKDEEPAILRAAKDGRLGAAASARVLAGMSDPGALALLVEKLGDPSPSVRAEAANALSKSLARTPSGLPVDAIVALLQGEALRREERPRYVALLGRTRSARALPTLLTLAKSTRLEERREAVTALGGMPAGDADAALLEALADDEPAVRENASRALAEGGGDKACAALVERLERGGAGERPLAEIGLAGCLARASAATHKAAGARLSGERDSTRDALAEGLGRAATADAKAALVALAGSPDAHDRRKAAEALVKHGAGDVLARLGDDGDGSVRAAALFALGASKDASARDLLVKHVPDDDARAAANAATALGRLPADAQGKTALCAASKDVRASVRAAALHALSRTGTRCAESGEDERTLLGDPSSLVRAAAARALRVSTRTPADDRALARCVAEEPILSVARACADTPKASADEEAVVVVVVGEGGRPRATAPFALSLADGTVRYGTTDRRGSVLEVVAPKGVVTLLP